MQEGYDTFSSRVSINVSVNIIRTIVMALTGFLMVPYYIGSLGMATYAIIPLITSVTTYFLAMSDSLADAFTRYTAISVQNGDSDAVNRTFTSSVIGMAKCVAMLMPVVIILSVVAPFIFNIGDTSDLSVQLTFFMIITSTLMLSFSACMGSVFMAYNKMYITYVGRIIQCLLQVGLVVLLFYLDTPSLTFVGISYIVAIVVFLLIMLASLKKVCPTIKFSREYYDRELLSKMGRLGLWAVIAELGALLFIQTSMVVVNVMIGSEAQGSFSVAANILSMINTACTAVSASVIPLIYRSYANKDTDGMIRTLKVFSKFIGLLMAFPIAYAVLFTPQVIQVWIGSGYDDIYPMLYVMLPVEVAVCVSSAMICVPIVYARLRHLALMTVVLGVLNVIMAIVFIEIGWGTLGACIAWAISMVLLKMIFYPSYASKLTTDTHGKYVHSLTSAYLSFIVAVAIGLLIRQFYTLPSTWMAILLSATFSFGIYLIIMFRFMFNDDEKRMMETFLPGFLQRF